MLEIDGGELSPGFGWQFPEKDVRNRHDDVQVLRARDVDEERYHGEDVDPIEDLMGRDSGRALPANGLEPPSDRRRHRAPGGGGIATLGDPSGILAEHADHDGRDQAEDDERIDLIALVELARPDDQSIDQRHQDPDKDQDAEQILKKRDPGVSSNRGQAEARNYAFTKRLHDRRQQHDEAVEDEEMQEARIEVAEHAGMRTDVRKHAPDPLRDIVEPIFVRAQPQNPVEPPGAQNKVDDGGQQHHEDRDRLDQRHLW